MPLENTQENMVCDECAHEGRLAPAPLIREIERADIAVFDPELSDEGVVVVEFLSLRDCDRFLRIVVEYDTEPDSIYQRVVPGWGDKVPTLPCWGIHVTPFDHGGDEWGQ